MNGGVCMNKRKWIILIVSLVVGIMNPLSVHAASVPVIKYQAHVQDNGWLPIVESGKIAGTEGKSKRLEAVKIYLTDKRNKSMVQYRAHVSDIGWQSWKKSGQLAGTTGKSKPIEAVQIKLTGSYKNKYDIYYRVHVTNRGWLGWAKNGAVAGSTGLSLRAEAIQIKIVKKGSRFNTNGCSSLSVPVLTSQAHVQNLGWMGKVNNEAVIGTVGKAYRLEALKLNLKDFDGKNGITYRAHVSNIGWQPWKNSGQIAGTTGKSLPIEAVQISLSKSLSNYLDIYYRVHVSNKGWLGWAKNGEIAGTTGGHIQAEAIQIKIVSKSYSFNREGAAYVNVQNTSGIELNYSYMTSSRDQFAYSTFVTSDGNVGCMATAYAIGYSIIDKRNYSPVNFWNGRMAYDSLGRCGGYICGFNAADIYNNLKNGKPSLLHYGYGNSGQHWVTIIGIRSGANVNNLQPSDFIVIDPSGGGKKMLNACSYFSNAGIRGYKKFK